MRTVTLELLRHGPSHNQLLSPLTPYLALCENHAPVTINVPFEHNQFLHRLASLTYELGDSQLAENQRQFQLGDTGRELGRLLAGIPGLTAELNRFRESDRQAALRDGGGERNREVIHLRLVLSASELALIPFELVLAGNGFPGFGQALFLQNDAPICLTREVRRVKDVTLPWTARARVLLVSASPAGLPPVPVEAHLLALRRAIDPWVAWFPDGDETERRRQVDACLQVLPAASIGAIQAACASGDYSHVHILAHGLARHDGFDLRFGIALHDDANPSGAPDVVSGDRLASALRPLVKPGRTDFARPMVVTLASCNGANGGSVVGAGASVAHALQEAGIPLVVAGQFPLTFEGSVELVETLYDGLLWGADPRALLLDVRRRMHVLQPRSHDWAALTAYATLPGDFDDQLCALTIARARAAVEVAMNHADRVVPKIMDIVNDAAAHGGRRDHAKAMAQRARERIQRPWDTMTALADRLPKRRVELVGLLASLYKRRAEIELATGMLLDKDDPTTLEAPLALLQRGRSYYREYFKARPDSAWATVQYLVLSLLCDVPAASASQADTVKGRRRTELQRLWWTAWYLSLNDQDTPGERGGWALGNLIELPLIARLMDQPPPPGDKPWDEQARDRVTDLLERAAALPFQIYSTRRQLGRYADWFPLVNGRFNDVADLANALIDEFPGDADVFVDADT